jgi:hypothetical protein
MGNQKEWRVVDCLGDKDRPYCRATVKQRLRADDGWEGETGGRWPFCPECDAAYAARQAKRGTDDR